MSRRRLHMAVALIWTALIPPAVLWWSESVSFLVFASLWANIYAAFAAYEGADDALTEADKTFVRGVVYESRGGSLLGDVTLTPEQADRIVEALTGR